MYKLIVTDLDNTLLNKDGEVEESTKELLKKLDKQVKIAIATGRSLASAKAIADELGSQSPMICYNGAEIVDENGKIIYSSNVSKEVQREIVEYVIANDLYLQVYDKGEIVVSKLNLKAHPDPDLKYASYRETGSIEKLKEITTPKLLIAVDPKKAYEIQEELEKKFEDRAYFAKSEEHLIEVMNIGTDKGQALKVLSNHLNVKKEEVMALGDNTNDIRLIEEAGLGVAVANSVESLKKIAGYVCKNERSKGFNEAIQKFVIERIWKKTDKESIGSFLLMEKEC